jgi:hypothetical protein
METRSARQGWKSPTLRLERSYEGWKRKYGAGASKSKNKSPTSAGAVWFLLNFIYSFLFFL